MKLVFFLLLAINGLLLNSFAQKKVLTFQPVNPNPFGSDSVRISVAILPLSNQDSLISETFYMLMKNNEKLRRRFDIYSYTTLLQTQRNFRIRNLSPTDSDCLKTLNELLNIKFIIIISEVDTGIKLDLRNTITEFLEFTSFYIDTDSSSAMIDLLKFFTDDLKAIYLEKGRLEINASPNEALLNINAVEYNIPFNSNLNPGDYIVTIKKEGFKPINEKIKIEAGQTVYKMYYLEEAFGKIKINLFPENTSYRMLKRNDSSAVLEGIGDFPESQFQEGKYLFEFKSLGFTPENRLFFIKADQLYEENISLRRSFYPIVKIKTNEDRVAQNLKITPSEWDYVIHYNLIGDPDETYDVMLYLVSDSEPDKKFHLYGLSGDLGENIRVGFGKLIKWNITPENNISPLNENISKYSFYLEID